MRTDNPIKINPDQEKKSLEAENNADKHSDEESESESNNYSAFFKPLDWDGFDAFCLFILMFLGIFSRFWIIQYPRHFTDDEALHVQYINCYQNGSFFLMSQPPLAEMCLAGVSTFSFYKQNYLPPYYEENFTFPTMEYVALRSPSAFASAIVIPLSFFIVRLLGSSTFGAFGAGLFTLFDFLLIGNARNIGTDGFVQLFVAMTMLFTALLKRLKKNTVLWGICFFLQAFFCGCSFASDWSCVSLIFFVAMFNIIACKDAKSVPKTIAIVFAVFFSAFIAHTLLLPYKTGNESVLSDTYINDLYEFGKDISPKHSHLISHVIEVIKKSAELHRANSKRVSLYKWVTMTCPWKVLWTQLGRTVAVFGNLPVWWGISVTFVCQLLKSFLTRKLKETTTLIFCGFVEVLAYYMLFFSERGLRDYQVALLFGIWGLALTLDVELPSSTSGFLIALLIVTSGLLFIVWAPLVYGYNNFDVRFLPYFAK